MFNRLKVELTVVFNGYNIPQALAMNHRALCETVMQVVILETVVMSDVVDDSAFQQARAVEQCLPLVTS